MPSSRIGRSFLELRTSRYTLRQVSNTLKRHSLIVGKGESYAGLYIPYISAGMLDKKDREYYDLSGNLIIDPCIGDCGWVQGFIPTTQFALNNQVILNINQSLLDNMVDVSAKCGVDEYMSKYLQFPPPNHQPREHEISKMLHGCWDVVSDFSTGVQNKNPCFDVYHIPAWCPTLPDPMGTYFNRMDVKKAIHAPLNKTWRDCSLHSVFAGSGEDNSPLSIEAALPQVIEATNRVLVANGNYDALLYTNGEWNVVYICQTFTDPFAHFWQAHCFRSTT